MRTKPKHFFVILLSLSLLVLGYQNCGKGFEGEVPTFYPSSELPIEDLVPVDDEVTEPGVDDGVPGQEPPPLSSCDVAPPEGLTDIGELRYDETGKLHYGVVGRNQLKKQLGYMVEVKKACFPEEEMLFELGEMLYPLSDCSYGPSSGEQYCLKISGVKGFHLKGQGKDKSILLVKGIENINQGGIQVLDSSQVELSDFRISYEYKPFFQGAVVSKNYTSDGDYQIVLNPLGDKQASIELLNASTGGHGILYDSRILGKRKEGSGTYISGHGEINQNGNESNYVFNYKNVTSNTKAQLDRWVEVGDHLVYTARVSRSAIRFIRNSDIKLTKVKITESPAGAIVGVLNGGQQIIDSVEVVPQEGHVIASNADGIHFQDSKGGLHIKDSVFRSLGDDGIAIYNTGMKMNSSSGEEFPASFSVSNSDYAVALSRVNIGDELQLVDVINKKLIITSRVERIVKQKDYTYIRLEDAFLERLVASAEQDVRIYNVSLGGVGSVIENNRIEKVRRAGINLKSIRGIIRNNTFIDVDIWGIAAHVENSALNSGPLAIGHQIIGNRFEGALPTRPDSINIRMGLFSSPANPSSENQPHYQFVLQNNQHNNNAPTDLQFGSFSQ